MSDDIAISVQNVSKAYRIWRDPAARLKAPLWDILGSVIPEKLRPKTLQERLAHQSHSHYYKDFYALKDVSFEVKKGETVGLIGRNGSGKSTILQMIVGTLAPSAGDVKSYGRIAALLELGSGFNPDFTGRENVFINASVLGFKRNEIASKFDEIAAFADIGEFIDQPVKTYSSGMTVRLAFAVQSVVIPDILIVDEALAVGDEAFQRKCFGKLEDLKKHGTTILMVTHDSSTIVQLCDRAILLETGRVYSAGKPRDVVRNYQRLLYSGNVEPSISAEAEVRKQDDDRKPISSGEYNPALISQTIELYDKGICSISGWGIANLAGAKVNVLKSGCVYQLEYRVKFHKQCHSVRFGCSIKNLKGFVFTGALNVNRAGRIEHARPGFECIVRFNFDCRIMEGTYFWTLGVFHQASGEEQFAGRVVDAIMFRVGTPGAEAVSTELVDLLSPLSLEIMVS
jgi:lipopolysaccharide transport system ATP-binding protein